MVRLLVMSLLILALIPYTYSLTDQEKVYLAFKNRNDICRLPYKRGNCGAPVVGWYYNFDEGRCVKLSQCRGNRNRFNTKKRCSEFCLDYKLIGY